MKCESRLMIIGVFSILVGILANKFGRYTMDLYDINEEEDYKKISIALFSIGVVFIAYGFLNIFWNDKNALCNLSFL